MSATLLLLADGRLPAGGHTHSGGVEAAVADGTVRDLVTLAEFLRSRLFSSGLTTATLAVTAHGATDLHRVDAVADARTPSPAQRAASRAQGRALLRLARRTWPHPRLDELGAHPHHPVALGVTCAAAGLDETSAATAAALSSISGPASAALRLLGLDPVGVTAAQARLAGEVDVVAALAVADPGRCPGSPLLDVLAERHAASPVPLFAS